jgi:CheY-like chemotaxis protein
MTMVESGAQPRAAPRPLEGVRILVVDDDVDARELLQFILRHAGALVETAASVREALEIVDEGAPRVVVSDISMPGQDGYDLIRLLRARELSPGDLPALAITAHARTEHRQRALAAGFQEYLTKPIDPDKLVRAVRDLMRPRES